MASERSKWFKTFGILGGALACVGLAFAVHATTGRAGPAQKQAGKTAAGGTATAKRVKKSADKVLVRVDAKQCTTGDDPTTRVEVGNPKARRAAQNGLDFLAANTKAWQKTNQCYGCHVQAVTLEGMVVGRHNQYNVSNDDLAAVLDGLLKLPGGSRTAGGLQYRGGQLLPPSKAFGGAALARYDAAMDHKVSDDLFKVAEELLGYQREDGAYGMTYSNPPVAVGDIQGTYLAIRTWKQAYERSADDRWLTAVQKAERYLQRRTSELLSSGSSDVQQLSYSLLGLIEAGVGASEELPSSLRRKLLEQQLKDGGWPLWANSAASPFATGQVLYALRLGGMTDNEKPIRRGTDWLIEHQNDNGGWSSAGSARAEAMWAVLGLVSLDVLTVAISEVQDGQRAKSEQRIVGHATDNKGGSVVSMEITIDDIRVASECAGAIEYTWNTRSIEDGKHVAVIAATNSRGEVSKRRIELYTGDIFITQTGTRYTADGTVVSARNIASDSDENTVRMRIYERDAVGNSTGAELATVEQKGAQGAMQLLWDGNDTAGKAAASGKYNAKLEVLNKAGEVVQTKEIAFANESREKQRAQYGEIEGQLKFQGGGSAENSWVELVDGAGNVVDRVASTKNGQYRFRNVDKGDYKVRLKKRGYAAAEAPVSAAPAGAPAKADMVMTAEEE